MNKNIELFGMALLAGAAMTSCSNEDDVTNPDDTYLSRNGIISFSLQSSQPSTKVGDTADDPCENRLESFSVDILPNLADNLSGDSPAYMVKNHKFTKGTDGIYTSDPQYYWPTRGSLNFYAISPVDKTTQAESVDETSKTYQRTVSEWNGTTDLMAAVSINSDKSDRDPGSKAYPLIFKHITSDVTAKFKAADETKDLTYVIKSLTMTAPNSGTYTFSNETKGFGSWSIPTETLGTYDFLGSNNSPMQFVNKSTGDEKATVEVSKYYYILPTTDGTLTFTVEYEVYQSGKKILSFTKTDGTAKAVGVTAASLEMGKSYTYVLALPASEADPITFTVSKEDFEETVEKDVTIPNNVTINGHKFIDLGLPSGLLWAETNVGAETAADRGDYYAWGETKTKVEYSATTYAYYEYPSYTKYNDTDGKTTLEATDDAATECWGTDCRTPTKAEWEELINNCTWKLTTQTNSLDSEISGYQVTSKANGNSIFLPRAGWYDLAVVADENKCCFYWSSSRYSSVVYAYYFMSGETGASGNISPTSGYYLSRYFGCPVRPVAKQ